LDQAKSTGKKVFRRGHFGTKTNLSSFVLKQKKQKFKTENSFHAKTTATNPLRDPSRQGSNSFIFIDPLLRPAFRIAHKAIPHSLLPCFAAERIFRSGWNWRLDCSEQRPYRQSLTGRQKKQKLKQITH
jgi:hypothetical protein